MFRIRFHGRGGQGVKTASRILGTAFFVEGYDVQDAPRYGAERRGAPIFAYVRAHPTGIDERGVITYPDLVIVVDDSLLQMGPAAVCQGMRDHTVLLIHSAAEAVEWADRLRRPPERVVRLSDRPGSNGERHKTSPGVRCAGAAARLFGTIGRQAVEEAVRAELEKLASPLLEHNVALALRAYDEAAPHEGLAIEGAKTCIDDLPLPSWVELPLDPVRIASPTIRGMATSLANPTGFWRTSRPILDASICKQCYWLCTTFCPDNVMVPDGDGTPVIDYDHCKGCMLCVDQCPHHAIEAVVEADWRADQAGGGAL